MTMNDLVIAVLAFERVKGRSAPLRT